jgi:hypothetical protein
MGRDKARKPRRERPDYPTVVVDGRRYQVRLPPMFYEIPRHLMPEIVSAARQLHDQDRDDNVITIG